MGKVKEQYHEKPKPIRYHETVEGLLNHLSKDLNTWKELEEKHDRDWSKPHYDARILQCFFPRVYNLGTDLAQSLGQTQKLNIESGLELEELLQLKGQKITSENSTVETAPLKFSPRVEVAIQPELESTPSPSAGTDNEIGAKALKEMRATLGNVKPPSEEEKEARKRRDAYRHSHH